MSKLKLNAAFCLLLFGTQLAYAQTSSDPQTANAEPAELPAPGPRAFPKVDIGAGRQLEFVGSFSADGKYKAMTKFGLFADAMESKSDTPEPLSFDGRPPDPAKLIEQDETNDVPPNIQLHRNEQVLEDFQPPERAVKVAKGNSVLEGLRDNVVSMAYGSVKVLMAPQSITTDSQQRVIVADPLARSLHVLAYYAKNSFEIAGGPGRRLQSPYGVAVDKDDNIFVSDSDRGFILVYDREGRYLRTIGTLQDESMLERPTSIAIDANAGRLYVLDPPRHELFIFDLQGNMLTRVGAVDKVGFSSRTGSTEPGRFSNPKALLLHNDELVVLDSTRVHILDLQGKFLGEFKIAIGARAKDSDPGLFMDDQNRIYVSDPGSGSVRVYTHDGQFLEAFGRLGVRLGEFNALAGMCTDSAGRVYIVDARRVQVYRFTGKSNSAQSKSEQSKSGQSKSDHSPSPLASR